MIVNIGSQEQMNEIVEKWQTAFELTDYDIMATFASFDELNQKGMNCGLFTQTVCGGWNSPLEIKILNDYTKYKNVSVDKQHDELQIIEALLQIKRRLHNCPTHYQGAKTKTEEIL